jgi:5-methylcytosine-specific restriction endonuclease McrA
MTTSGYGPERLTESELKAHVRELATRECGHLVELLRHLGEMDRRESYLGDGSPSLFAWCVDVLNFSESVAHSRIRAARAMRRFPAIGALVAAGELNVDAIARIAPHLTPDNHAALLDEARRAPRSVIDAIVARFQAPGPTRARIVAQAAPARPARVAATPAPVTISLPEPAPGPPPDSNRLALAAPAAPSAESGPQAAPAASPVSTEVNYRMHLTISAEAHADLLRLQDLLRHQVPDGDLARLVAMGLRMLRESYERKALGAGPVRRTRRNAARPHARPHAPPTTPPTTRHIPIAVRRRVRERDGDRCAFHSPEGRRCGERAWLEFHHVVPHARGGRATTGNIELRCRAHNRYEAQREFDGYVREPGAGYSYVSPRLTELISSCSASMSVGFTRWRSKPALRERLVTSDWLQPVRAMSMAPLSGSIWRMRRATS